MVRRLTYRTRHSYATKSNQHRVVKTPVVISWWSEAAFDGYHMLFANVCQIPHLRVEYRRSRLARNKRTVNRSYGGVLTGGALRSGSLGLSLSRSRRSRRC
ncbi:Large ribosomal subunit protein eL34-like protein [Drosera capensis]